MGEKTILVGLGNPLLDINAHVDAGFLQKYNLRENGAELVRGENEAMLLPIFEEVLRKEGAKTLPGGSILNTIRVFQWICQNINNRQCSSIFFGSIGDDEHGRMLVEKLGEVGGVDGRFQQIRGMPTGKCATLVNGVNRSMCALLGAANSFSVDFLELPQNRAIIGMARFFYSAGFFLAVSPQAIMRFAEYAAQSSAANKVFAFNLSAPYVPGKFKDQLAAILPFVHILFGNEEEARAFAVANEFGEVDDVVGIAERMEKMINPTNMSAIVITRGPLPIIVAQKGRQIRQFPVPSIPEGKFVDTIGAGDAFVGGFLAALIANNCLEKCIEWGCLAAATIIQHSGCTFPPKCQFGGDGI